MIEGIAATWLPVSDMKRAVAFYAACERRPTP
jgi:hypothetical protein